MKARVLPPEEWVRITMRELQPPLWPSMNPDDVEIVVVEDDGEIVATMSLLRVVHMESVWIDPRWRGNAGVVRRLLGATIGPIKQWARSWFVANAADDSVRDILRRLGGIELPIDTYMMHIEKMESPCLTRF